MIDPTPAKADPQTVSASGVIAYPTLEDLFGSMDYCLCEQCRSILSPAAYLVDLLLFLEKPGDPKNPLTELLKRRPDILYLPLTCENTNMPVPYIDVVNETLEYFVTNNGSIDNYTGHDTDGSASAEELLANPQFVDDVAYNTLKTALFPLPLPFYRSLEILRRYVDTFKVPLQKAMEVLLTESVNAAPAYTWRDILMEQLKISPAEYSLLTDDGLTLQQLYGYPLATSNDEVLYGRHNVPDHPDQPGLSNVKAFTRRMGISYEDIIELLKTRFINPNSILIPRLERLGVSFSAIQVFVERGNDHDFDAQVQLANPDPAAYGGNIKKWVKDNYAHIMGLITIAGPPLVQALIVPVKLNAGNNTILFSNVSAWAPDFDGISVGSTIGTNTATGYYSAEATPNTLTGGRRLSVAWPVLVVKKSVSSATGEPCSSIM